MARRAPILLWQSARLWTEIAAIGSVVLAVMGISTGWPLWSPLVPIGILFLYGLLRANYERFQELEADRDKIAVERDELAARIAAGRDEYANRHREEKTRTAVENRLASLQEEGANLRTASHEDIDAWAAKTKGFIEAAFGRAEAQLFLSDAGYTVSEDVQGFISRPEEVRLEFRLRRLSELIARSGALAIGPHFDPAATL